MDRAALHVLGAVKRGEGESEAFLCLRTIVVVATVLEI